MVKINIIFIVVWGIVVADAVVFSVWSLPFLLLALYALRFLFFLDNSHCDCSWGIVYVMVGFVVEIFL